MARCGCSTPCSREGGVHACGREHRRSDREEEEDVRLSRVLKRCGDVEEKLRAVKREGRELGEKVEELEDGMRKQEGKEKRREKETRKKERGRGRWVESDSDAERGCSRSRSRDGEMRDERRAQREREKELKETRRIQEHVLDMERALLRRLDELLEETRSPRLGRGSRHK